MENFLFGFIGQLVWWEYAVITLFLTHITIVTVTLYLHRSKTHRALDFHPVLEHFFRFWNWLTTGMVVKEWVAIHRRHHAKCETKDDPHSPYNLGIVKMLLFLGAWAYNREAKRPEVLAYAEGDRAGGLPADSLEYEFYSKYKWLGVGSLLVIQTTLFGVTGIIIWIIQMLWIPFWAAGVINGVGHYWGYRNADTKDQSRNIFPWGIVIGGEELHNNHHAYPTSAKFSLKALELDIGWLYIQVLEVLKLATVYEKRVARFPVSLPFEKVLSERSFLKLFKHHLFYIAQKFGEIKEIDSENEKVKLLINKFLEFLKPTTKIDCFELERWIGAVFGLEKGEESEELKEFANWLRSLHEADEPVVQRLKI